MQKMKLLLCMLGLLLLSLSKASADTLNLRTLHNPPLEYEENGVVTGALSEIVAEAVKRTGRDVLIELRPWKRAQKEVEDGDADGCFNTGNTEWRREWAYFNEDVLYNETYALFLRSDDSVKIPADMKNVSHLRVGIQRGYAYGGEFQKALDEKRFKEISEVESIEQNIKKLISKRIDFFVGDRIPSLYYLELAGVRKQVSIFKDDVTGQEVIVSVWPTYVAFSKKTVSSEYVKKFNDALLQIKKDGTYQRIFDKYSK